LSVIEATGLTKIYGSIKAVEDLSFKLRKGEILGLLGPNGAGKTTTIGMLTTIIKPTRGTARVCGYDVQRDKSEVRKHIILVPQEPAMDLLLSVYDSLYFYAWLQGVPKALRHNLILNILDELELRDKVNSQIISLSTGLQRRVQLARAFLIKRDVIFLDEPTLGLDPISKMKAWNLIKSLVKDGETSVIVATNDMREAEVLCDRVLMLKTKPIIISDVEELKRIRGLTAIRLSLKDDGKPDFSFLNDINGVVKIEYKDGNLEVVVNDSSVVHQVISQLIYRKFTLLKVQTVEPSIEDIFFLVFGVK
jgi:ABC-2 type transport system ATP-binding protein